MAGVGEEAVSRTVSTGISVADGPGTSGYINYIRTDWLFLIQVRWLTVTLLIADIQSTFNAYSTFCSANAPNDYEKRLVAATEASQPAKQVMTGERRYGRTRQDLEDALVSNSKVCG